MPTANANWRLTFAAFLNIIFANCLATRAFGDFSIEDYIFARMRGHATAANVLAAF